LRTIIVLLIALFLALPSAAFARSLQPIYNASNAIPIPAQGLPSDRMEVLIVEAGGGQHWTFERAEPGHLLATYKASKYQLVVDVRFDSKIWQVVYKSSEGLREHDGEIHPTYNKLVRKLESAITVRLSNALH
jgi:hypothetical protein